MINRQRDPDHEDPMKRSTWGESGTTERSSTVPSTGWDNNPSNPLRKEDESGKILDKAQQKGGEIAGQAQQKTGEMMDQAREQVGLRLSDQKGRTADTLNQVAQAVRHTGDQLREQDQGSFAQYADRTAEQIERFSGYLREKDMQDMVGEVEQFARRQPMLFLGGALLAGFLGARFLKSTSPSVAGPRGYTGQPYQSQGLGGANYPYGSQRPMGQVKRPTPGIYPTQGLPSNPGLVQDPAPSTVTSGSTSGVLRSPNPLEDIDEAA